TGELGEQPRLADPRLARQQQRAASAGAHALQARAQAAELVLAADQPGLEAGTRGAGGGLRGGGMAGGVEQEREVLGERERVGMALRGLLAQRPAEEGLGARIERG